MSIVLALKRAHSHKLLKAGLVLLLVCIPGSEAVAGCGAGRPGTATERRMEVLLRQAIYEGRKATKISDPKIGSPKLPVRQPDDYWSGVLQLTRTDDPMISSACRNEVARKVAEKNSDKDAETLDKHIQEQAETWQNIQQGTEVVRLSQWMRHLEDCSGFCGATVGGLLNCHLEGVPRNSHMIVVFQVDQPKPGIPFQFRNDDRSHIVEFTRKALAANQRIMIEARASNLGPHERLPYNLSLAGRRANVVRELVLSQGLPADRLLIKSVTWEPPRLVAREVAIIYGFENLWNSLDNHHYLDQSVVLIAYKK